MLTAASEFLQWTRRVSGSSTGTNVAIARAGSDRLVLCSASTNGVGSIPQSNPSSRAGRTVTGESCSLYLPRLDGDCYEVFLTDLSQTYPDDLILLLRDNAPAHIKHDLDVPDNIIPVALPPFSPELNPVERWFLEFRRLLANRCFNTIDTLHEALTQVLGQFTADKERLELLTNFPWWHFGISQLDELLNVT